MKPVLFILLAGLCSCSAAMPIPEDAGASIDGGDIVDGGNIVDAGTCPTDLPYFPVYTVLNDDIRQRVGATVTFEFGEEARTTRASCVRITLVDPAGATTTFDDIFSATVTLDTAGLYTATLTLKSDATRSRSIRMQAVAEPPANPPCASFARGCGRVGRSGIAFACDDVLLNADGGELARLDGGVWFAADDTLFAWNDGALRVVALDGGTPSTISSTPWSQKPLLWSADRHQLAVWNEDGGARFSVDNGLTKLGEFNSDIQIDALAVQTDGGMLTISPTAERLACPLEGVCAQLPGLSGIRAANDTTVWATTVENFHYTRVFRLQHAADGTWTAQSLVPFWGIPAQQLNRRALDRTPWGARRLDQQTGDMRFDGATSGGTTDDLVWLTDGSTTRVWCE